MPAVECEKINELKGVNGKCDVLFSRRSSGFGVVFEGAVNFVEFDITLVLLMVVPELKLVDNFEGVNVGYDVPIYKCVTSVNFEEATGYEIVSILLLPMDEGVTMIVLEIFILDGTLEGSKEVGWDVSTPEAVDSFLEYVNVDGKLVENCSFISVRRDRDV